LEKVISAEAGLTYPRCIRRKQACPAEKCGGDFEYADLLEVLADAKHKEHLKMTEWAEMQTGGPYNSVHFDPAEVVFSDRRTD